MRKTLLIQGVGVLYMFAAFALLGNILVHFKFDLETFLLTGYLAYLTYTGINIIKLNRIGYYWGLVLPGLYILISLINLVVLIYRMDTSLIGFYLLSMFFSIVFLFIFHKCKDVFNL